MISTNLEPGRLIREMTRFDRTHARRPGKREAGIEKEQNMLSFGLACYRFYATLPCKFDSVRSTEEHGYNMCPHRDLEEWREEDVETTLKLGKADGYVSGHK